MTPKTVPQKSRTKRPNSAIGIRVRFRLIVTFRVTSLGRLLALSHTYRPGGVRVIRARRVTRLERKVYEEG